MKDNGLNSSVKLEQILNKIEKIELDTKGISSLLEDINLKLKNLAEKLEDVNSNIKM